MEQLLLKQGAKWWCSEDLVPGSVSLSKKSLGEFIYHALCVGGYIGEIWPLNHKFPRSWVGITVLMTDKMKTEFEANCKFKLREPPKVHVNGS